MSQSDFIKVDSNFGSNPKIKILRKMPHGDTMALVFILLLCIAKRSSGGCLYVTGEFAHDAETLAIECDVNTEIMSNTISTLKKLQMIDEHNGVFYIVGWEDHQNEDALEKYRARDRAAKQRKRSKTAQKIDGVWVDTGLLEEGGEEVVEEIVKQEIEFFDSKPEVDSKDPEQEQSKPALKEKKESQGRVATSNFEEFWEEYPRKVGKKAAEKAYIKAIKGTSPLVIANAIRMQVYKKFRFSEEQYIPHAATWLNAGRWSDETETQAPVQKSSTQFLGGAY